MSKQYKVSRQLTKMERYECEDCCAWASSAVADDDDKEHFLCGYHSMERTKPTYQEEK